MSGTIWLIAESRGDGDIVTALVNRRYPHVRVQIIPLVGKPPNIARLAIQVESLIQVALERRKGGDCIAVLHDADLQTRPHNRDDYDKIRTVCRKYKQDVVLVIASDEIESWLLADSGICRWLKLKPENWDERAKPSKRIQNRMDEMGKLKYRPENLPFILKHLQADGDQFSPSLKAALTHLDGAPCTRA